MTGNPTFNVGDILANYSGGIHIQAYEVIDNSFGVYRLRQIPSGNYFTWDYGTVEAYNTLWTPESIPFDPTNYGDETACQDAYCSGDITSSEFEECMDYYAPTPTPTPTPEPEPEPEPEPNLPIVLVTLVEIAGDTVTVQFDCDSGDAAWASYSPQLGWDDGTGSQGICAGQYTHTYTESGTYMVNAYGSDVLGNSDDDGVEVTVVVPEPYTSEPEPEPEPYIPVFMIGDWISTTEPDIMGWFTSPRLITGLNANGYLTEGLNVPYGWDPYLILADEPEPYIPEPDTPEPEPDNPLDPDPEPQPDDPNMPQPGIMDSVKNNPMLALGALAAGYLLLMGRR